PEPGWIPKRLHAFSNHFSRPKKKAKGQDSDFPPFTELSNRAVGMSAWIAQWAKEVLSKFSFHARQTPPLFRIRECLPPCKVLPLLVRFSSSKTKIPSES